MSDENTQPQGDLSGKSFGQYDILDQLGQGGMATVYRARQTSIGRTVAVKVMPSYFVHEPTFMQRFEREVRVIAELQHPRVLPVYDYGQIEGRPYIVMAYMPGGTLADRISEGPLPLNEVLQMTRQIAEGLDHAHRKGVIHRDFKPSNVLLDEHGNAYLADFGIAKISESTVQLTGTGVVGTPAYMAPEMATGDIVTPAVDIYALGVTLFQMLTGRLPFRGETPLSVMMAHASDPVPDVRELRPDLPEGIATVVMRALAKNPAERYASAGALVSELEQAARGEDIGEAPAQPARGFAPVSTATRPVPPPAAPAPPGEWQVAGGTPAPHMTPAPPAPQKRGGCRWGLWAIVGVGALALAACGGFFLLGRFALLRGATPTPQPPPPTLPQQQATPVPTSAPPPTAATGGGAGGFTSLVLDNQSSVTVCYVQVSPSDSDTWGEDRLGSDEVIAAGASYTVSDLPNGQYDYRALDCDQNVLSAHYGVELAGGSQSWAIRDATATLTLINNSSYAICELYVSSIEDTVWGVNLLAEGVTVPGGQSHSVPVAPGTYDMRAEGCDGSSYWEESGVTIDTVFEWTLND